VAAKLGPILHLGESLANESKQVPTIQEPNRSESSFKYEKNEIETDYYRETTIATVSGIAIPDSDRSALDSARSSYAGESAEKDKDFASNF
jgi:hypothetical protein